MTLSCWVLTPITLTPSNIENIVIIHDGKNVLNDNISCGGAALYGRVLSRGSLEQQAIAVGFMGDTADGKNFTCCNI